MAELCAGEYAEPEEDRRGSEDEGAGAAGVGIDRLRGASPVDLEVDLGSALRVHAVVHHDKVGAVAGHPAVDGARAFELAECDGAVRFAFAPQAELRLFENDHADFGVGLPFRFEANRAIAAEVGYQYGISAISLPETAGAEPFEASGTASGYDLRLTATWLVSSSFGVGVSAGWLMATYELSDDVVDLSVDQANWFAGIEAVWRFTDAPPRLE